MNIRLRLPYCIILFFVGIGLYLFITNLSPILALRGNVLSSQIEFANWSNTSEGYIAQPDPQIVMSFPHNYIGYVETIEIKGTFNPQPDPRVYYTSNSNEDFTEENSSIPPYLYSNNSLRIQLNRWVANGAKIRVDVGENSGISLTNYQGFLCKYNFFLSKDDLLVMILILFLVLCVAALSLNGIKLLYIRLCASVVNFRHYTYLISNLVKKDITTKYRRSILGILWSVLNPLLMMAVISAVFRNLFRFQVPNFSIYYLTGSLIFNMMSEATSSSMTSILGASALIKKVYIPKYIFPLEKCLFALVNTLFSFVAVLIMMPILHVQITWTICLFFIPLFFTFVFSIGFGMIVASLTVFFRDISHLYSVWIVAWMYLTPVIYPMNILPNKMLQILQLNPMYYFVDYFRQVVMYSSIPGLMTNIICIIFSFGFFALGVFIFKKAQDRFILFL